MGGFTLRPDLVVNGFVAVSIYFVGLNGPTVNYPICFVLAFERTGTRCNRNTVY